MTDRAELISQSLEMVAERHGDPGPQIYAALFAAFPETEALFVRDTSGAVRGEMLAVTFQCLMDVTGAGAYAANLIAAERVNHAEVGVPPAAFAQFLPIVMSTCRDLAGEGWTPQVEAAWVSLIAELHAGTAAAA